MSELLYEVKDKVATITLNRPDKLNAFTRDIIDGWSKSLGQAQADDDVNVVIVTGAGRAFCSGGDVGRMREGEPSALDGKNGLWEGVHRVPKQLEQMDKPVIAMVKERGASKDPIVRQKIAQLYISEQALQFNGYRSLTRIMRGGHPGPEGSTAKLLWSQTDVELAQTATEILGPYSQLEHGTPWAPDEGQWEFYELLARGSGIRAGTTEILKNILGERVLGLPKD